MSNLSKEYWNKKVKRIVDISKEHGYPEQNEEFWEHQPAGVISLIVKMDDRYSYKCQK